MRSRSCKQIWGTLRSEISVAFEIFGQEVARWRYWSFPGWNENELRDEMLAASLVILPFFISICARFRRNYWPKDYHSISCPHSNGKNHHQSSCRVWTCPNYVIVDDSRSYCMIVLLQTYVIVEIIINYHDRFNGSLHTGALQLTKRFSCYLTDTSSTQRAEKSTWHWSDEKMSRYWNDSDWSDYEGKSVGWGLLLQLFILARLKSMNLDGLSFVKKTSWIWSSLYNRSQVVGFYVLFSFLLSLVL